VLPATLSQQLRSTDIPPLHQRARSASHHDRLTPELTSDDAASPDADISSPGSPSTEPRPTSNISKVQRKRARSSSPDVAPPPPSKRRRITVTEEYNIVFTERLGVGRVGDVWRGTLSLTGDDHREPVIGKVVRDRDSCDAENEASFYALLNGSEGLPRFYVIFGDCCGKVLLLEDAGNPVTDRDIRALPYDLRVAALKAVQDLHDRSVLHGDPALRNLAYSEAKGRLYLLDLDQACFYDRDQDSAAAADELAEFRSLLCLDSMPGEDTLTAKDVRGEREYV